MQALKNFSTNARMYLAFNFLVSLYVGIANVIFNLYIMKLGYNEQFLGLIVSVTMIATGIFAFPAAQLCDRIGSKKSLILSGILSAAVLFLLYVLTSQEWLLILSLLSGIFSTVPTIIAAPFMCENSTSEDRIYLFSFNFAIFVVATVLGMAIGGYLPQIWSAFFHVDSSSILSYRYTLYASLIVAVISIIPLAFLKEQKKVCVNAP